MRGARDMTAPGRAGSGFLWQSVESLWPAPNFLRRSIGRL